MFIIIEFIKIQKNKKRIKKLNNSFRILRIMKNINNPFKVKMGYKMSKLIQNKIILKKNSLILKTILNNNLENWDKSNL